MSHAQVAEEPVADLPYNKLHSGPLMNVDETPAQVLKEPGRANTLNFKHGFLYLLFDVGRFTALIVGAISSPALYPAGIGGSQ